MVQLLENQVESVFVKVHSLVTLAINANKDSKVMNVVHVKLDTTYIMGLVMVTIAFLLKLCI